MHIIICVGLMIWGISPFFYGWLRSFITKDLNYLLTFQNQNVGDKNKCAGRKKVRIKCQGTKHLNNSHIIY